MVVVPLTFLHTDFKFPLSLSYDLALKNITRRGNADKVEQHFLCVCVIRSPLAMYICMQNIHILSKNFKI